MVFLYHAVLGSLRKLLEIELRIEKRVGHLTYIMHVHRNKFNSKSSYKKYKMWRISTWRKKSFQIMTFQSFMHAITSSKIVSSVSTFQNTSYKVLKEAYTSSNQYHVQKWWLKLQYFLLGRDISRSQNYSVQKVNIIIFIILLYYIYTEVANKIFCTFPIRKFRSSPTKNRPFYGRIISAASITFITPTLTLLDPLETLWWGL